MSRRLALPLLLSPLVFGCLRDKTADKSAASAAQQSMAAMSAPVTLPPGAVFTEADVRFMQRMIAHHAQAIYMSRMASALDAAEKQTGAARGAALSKLATQVDADVNGAKDQARVKAMSAEIKRLAAVSSRELG